MADATRQYLVILHLGDASPSRLRGVVPAFKAALERLGIDAPEQAFRSSTGELFGYFMQSKLLPRQIASAIRSPARDVITGAAMTASQVPFLDNRDGLMVLELGDEFVAGGGVYSCRDLASAASQIRVTWRDRSVTPISANQLAMGLSNSQRQSITSSWALPLAMGPWPRVSVVA